MKLRRGVLNAMAAVLLSVTALLAAPTAAQAAFNTRTDRNCGSNAAGTLCVSTFYDTDDSAFFIVQLEPKAGHTMRIVAAGADVLHGTEVYSCIEVGPPESDDFCDFAATSTYRSYRIDATNGASRYLSAYVRTWTDAGYLARNAGYTVWTSAGTKETRCRAWSGSGSVCVDVQQRLYRGQDQWRGVAKYTPSAGGVLVPKRLVLGVPTSSGTRTVTTTQCGCRVGSAGTVTTPIITASASGSNAYHYSTVTGSPKVRYEFGSGGASRTQTVTAARYLW